MSDSDNPQPPSNDEPKYAPHETLQIEDTVEPQRQTRQPKEPKEPKEPTEPKEPKQTRKSKVSAVSVNPTAHFAAEIPPLPPSDEPAPKELPPERPTAPPELTSSP